MKKNALKKICGDKLSNFLVLNFNPEHVTPIIKKLFNNDGKDIRMVKENEWGALKTLLNNFEIEKEQEPVCQESPFDLLKREGYALYRCPTFESFNQFKPFYRKGELLCKFNDSSRAKNYNVFWIVKDGAKDIKPADKPTRQDEYGTSVCSISITKDGRNVAQICNRYNHTVNGCDNTFNSNLENIVQGLTDSFNNEFGFKVNKKSNDYEFENFVLFDGVYVYYKKEVNGNKIGDYTIVSDKIIHFDKNHFYQYLDMYFIDLRTKKIFWDKDLFGYHDAFVDKFKNVKKIVFVKDYEKVDDGGSDEICYIQK